MSLLLKYKIIFQVTASCALYLVMGYFLERTEFNQILLVWLSLFILFYFLIKNTNLSLKSIIAISFIFRLILLFQIPNLSQDFYRFIWDGRMTLEGLNPYLTLPQNFIQRGLSPIPKALELFNGMGQLNGSHYTNYPPILQLCFLITSIFSGKSIFGSIIVLRIIVILADIGTVYFGIKLLKKLNLPVRNIFLYCLNPFIIIEMTGNLHFEPVMLFFLIWSLYKLSQSKWVFSAVLIAFSISVKLIPLLFLPLFYTYFIKKVNPLGLIKLFIFYSIIFFVTILLFIPFYSHEFMNNFLNSLGLWFNNFEFNASIYYVFREIGYFFRGWNEIKIIGLIMPILTILFLSYLTFFRKNNSIKQLITILLFGLTFYYFTTTTVHPWYLGSLIILCVFTKYRFPIIWSFIIILSYQTYANIPWEENLWFVAVEYIVLYSYLIFELKKKNNILLT